MSYRSEDLERGIETLLQANIAAALVTVAARWVAIDAVTLPEPANWTRGYKSWILDLASTAFPYVVIMVPRRQPQASQAGRLGMQDVVVQVVISTFVVADDENDANAIAHRYIEAMVNILQTDQIVAGHKLSGHEQETRIVADSTQHLKAGSSGDYETATDVDYMRLCEVTAAYTVLS